MASASKEADRLRRLCERSMPAPAPGASAAAAAAGGLGSLAAPFLTRSTARGVVAATRSQAGAPRQRWLARRGRGGGRRPSRELAERGAGGARGSRRPWCWRWWWCRRQRRRRSELRPVAPSAGRVGRARSCHRSQWALPGGGGAALRGVGAGRVWVTPPCQPPVRQVCTGGRIAPGC